MSVWPRKMHVVLVAMARHGAEAKGSGKVPSCVVVLLLKVSSLLSMESML